MSSISSIKLKSGREEVYKGGTDLNLWTGVMIIDNVGICVFLGHQ